MMDTVDCAQKKKNEDDDVITDMMSTSLMTPLEDSKLHELCHM